MLFAISFSIALSKRESGFTFCLLSRKAPGRLARAGGDLRDVSERREGRGGEGRMVLRGYILTGTIHRRLILMIFLRGWNFGGFDK